LAKKRFRLVANKCSCGCSDGDKSRAVSGHSIETNLSAFTARRETYEGREHLVVPIVLLRHTVANNALIEADELIPESWNGVPVTVGHPATDGGDFQSANSPEVLSAWHVGRIFNAKMEGDKLKGEAWIDIERANNVAPELVSQLESGEPMDVSTGYFSKHEKASGHYGGKHYRVKHRDLKPDHLALLPNKEGACSWKDGCGVRTNESMLHQAINVLCRAVGIGTHKETTMKKTLIEKITANSKMKADELEMLDEKTLQMIANGLPAAKNADEEDDKKKKDEEKKPDANAKPLTEEGIAAIVANTLAKTLPAMLPAMLAEGERPALIERVTANGAITKAVAEKMDITALREVANAFAPADYSGRGAAMGTFNAAEENEELPVPFGTTEFYAQQRKAAQKGAN
jgi:hypothetical protein